VPDRITIVLAIPVLLFFPVLLISSNTLADMLTGGSEEHGWRGVMLPLMQKTMSPLVATFIIVVVWESWHLPLVFAGIYGEGNPLVILGVRILAMNPFAFLLTAIDCYSIWFG